MVCKSRFNAFSHESDSEDYEIDSEDSNDEKDDEDEDGEIYEEAGPSRTKALRNPTHQHQEAAEETMTHNHGYANHALTPLGKRRIVNNNKQMETRMKDKKSLCHITIGMRNELITLVTILQEASIFRMAILQLIKLTRSCTIRIWTHQQK
jgi:hypothetical protein